MKIFAIVALVTFFVVKGITYGILFFSRRGYVTDFGHVISIVLPIQSIFTYAGGFYIISGNDMGFAICISLCWLMLVVAILVIRFIPYAFCYITADDNFDCYSVADSVIKFLKKKDGGIILDDNIGVSNSIRVTFDKNKFSRREMTLLISEQYKKNNVQPSVYKISLLIFMVHVVEFIFDLSFLINICML